MGWTGTAVEKLAKSRMYSTQRTAKDPAWASERKASRIQAANLHRLALRIIVHQVKSVPCADCGQRYDVECMDLDHREGEDKVTNVGRMVSSGSHSEEIVLAEIAKCDVACSNCHRMRTKRRRDT